MHSRNSSGTICATCRLSGTRLVVWPDIPARDAVLARRKGDLWYVAGINGEQYGKTFDLTLPASGRAVLIRDKAGERNAVEQIPVEIPGDSRISLPVDGWGGFVLVIR